MAKLTAGDLIEQLETLPANCEVEFSGLTLLRLKMRDTNMVNFEFNELFRVIELQPAKKASPLPRRK